jgi:hypothetical protein
MAFSGSTFTKLFAWAQDVINTKQIERSRFEEEFNGIATGLTRLAAGTPIANDAISNAQLRNSAALSVIGRSANTVGDPADIVAANDGEVLRRSGTTVGFGKVATAGIDLLAVTTATIDNAAVTYAKIQDVSGQHKFLGRSSIGGGDVQEIDFGSWTTYTPSISAGSGTFTSVSATARFITLGKTTFVQGDISITANGTAGSWVLVSLPNTCANASSGTGRETSTHFKMLSVFTPSAGSTLAAIANYDNTYPGTDGAVLRFNFVYENS